MLASGSRADVQPAVALVATLARRGHAIRLVAPTNFATLAAGRGAEFHALPVDVVKQLHEPETEALLQPAAIR